MKITNISLQVKNRDRVNVSVDGKYRFSLDIFQVGELGIKVGKEYTDQELTELETESQFGKLYGRALEYTMMRPHSAKEVKDYLWRKTRITRVRVKDTNELRERPGVSQALADRVFDRLMEKGHLNDQNFARYWVENRQQRKGISSRKLVAELRLKGVDPSVIDEAMQNSPRDEKSEIMKIIEKKRNKYDDEQKLIAYLMRQGFSYDTIRHALSSPANFED
ncbi:MAG: RecX family transcriptional regulator [Candidatus Saccharimonadales bacterium]